MPYICLARSDIKDATLQIMDLEPNTSLRNDTIDPPGQTKYVNRTKNTDVGTDVNGLTDVQADGLQAYLLDKVEPGGLEQASATITCAANVNSGDTVKLMTNHGAGITFTAREDGVDGSGVANAVDPAQQEFDMSGDADATAASLRAAIIHADSITAMKGLAGNGDDEYMHATVANAVVTLVARKGAAVEVKGPAGNAYTLSTQDAAKLVISGGTLTRTNEDWNRDTGGGVKAVKAAANAIIARVDAGQALALADINTVLLAQGGAELTNAGGSSSVGTVKDILEVLAGRIYRLPKSSDKFTNAYTWDATLKGSFTRNVTVHGETWADGEYVPAAIGGDTKAYEHGGIRHTYDSTSFQVSLLSGHLSKLTGGISLFPDSDPLPHHQTTYQGALAVTTNISNARVVTVYDDDGTLLA